MNIIDLDEELKILEYIERKSKKDRVFRLRMREVGNNFKILKEEVSKIIGRGEEVKKWIS